MFLPSISKIMKDAGWRSSVPSSVLKDIRPNGMESPGDAQVFEKLMKDMTESQSNPPYSPKFHGLDQSSPIKRLKPPTAASRGPSSSPVRVESSWHTVDSQAPSSPPIMEEEGQSSWVTENTNEVPSPPVNLPLNRAVSPPPVKKLNRLNKAQELWAKLQTKARRLSIDSDGSRKSPESTVQTTGLHVSDDTSSNDKSVDYPKLSVGSSFISQISDHGRQPDITFDDSVGLNGDTPKAPDFDDNSFMNQADEATDVEEELPPHKATPASSRKPMLPDSFVDDENLELPQRSSTPDILRDSPSSDDAFPTIEEMFSQRGSTREKTTPIRSKPTKPIKAEKIQRQVQPVVFEDEDEETTPKASQRNSRPSQREQLLPTGSQIRKSPRQLKARGSQARASQSRPSQSQPPQGSQIVDLTLSSDIEEAAGSEAEPPRKFRTYSSDDDDEGPGWVQKKSSSQKPAGTRKQTTAAKASSQSSVNTSRRKTNARF